MIKALCQPQQQIRISQLPWWEPSDSRCRLSQNPFPLQGLVSWMGSCRAEPRGVREQASMREMWLSAGARPAATLSQLGGRAGCVRAGALPSVGSPARERETLQHGTALDNSRDWVAWGGLRKRVSEPSVSKGRTGMQRGREKRSPPPPPPRLLPLFPFIFPQQPEELLTVCQRCLGKKWGLMGLQNQTPSLSHCISPASPTLPLRWVQLPPEPVVTTGTLGVRHQPAKPHCFRTEVWEGWLAALCSNSQGGFQAPSAAALLSTCAASHHLGHNAASAQVGEARLDGEGSAAQELAVGCFPLGLPPLPRDYPAGFSTGMKSSCLLACLQIKGSKGIPAEYAPVGISVGNSGKHTRSGTEKGDQGHLKT